MWLYVIEVEKKYSVEAAIESARTINEYGDEYVKEFYDHQSNKCIGLFEKRLNKNDYKILEEYEIELEKEFKHYPFIYVDQRYRLLQEWHDFICNFYYYLQLKLNDFVEYKFKKTKVKITKYYEISERMPDRVH